MPNSPYTKQSGVLSLTLNTDFKKKVNILAKNVQKLFPQKFTFLRGVALIKEITYLMHFLRQKNNNCLFRLTRPTWTICPDLKLLKKTPTYLDSFSVLASTNIFFGLMNFMVKPK